MMALGMILFVLGMQFGLECLSYMYVYSTDEYRDTAERAKNMQVKINALKKTLLFGQNIKRKKEEKMLKVLEDSFRDYHR